MKVMNLIKPGNLIRCKVHLRHLIYWPEVDKDGHKVNRSRYLEKDKMALICDVAKKRRGGWGCVYECSMMIDGSVVKAEGYPQDWKNFWEIVE